MSKPVIIFGVGAFAELAGFYFPHDGGREVVGYTVDGARMDGNGDRFADKPLMAFEDLQNRYSADDVDLFVAVGYSKINRDRRDVCARMRECGYTLASYVSPKAVTYPTLSVGWNTFIFEANVIQPFTTVGNNVVLWSGNHIGHHSVIEDHVFIASHAVISGHCWIGEGTFIGVNATLHDQTEIGPYSVVGAGAMVKGVNAEDALFPGVTTKRADLPASKLQRL